MRKQQRAKTIPLVDGIVDFGIVEEVRDDDDFISSTSFKTESVCAFAYSYNQTKYFEKRESETEFNGIEIIVYKHTEVKNFAEINGELFKVVSVTDITSKHKKVGIEKHGN
jgi:hypothetical protein